MAHKLSRRPVCLAQVTYAAPPSAQHSRIPLPAQNISRRNLLSSLAFGAALILVPGNANANAISDFIISRQRQNGGAKLLQPLMVAQRRLLEADKMLQDGAQNYIDVLQMVRSSSLNCYMFEALPDDTIETRASLLTAKWQLSDPCTFRIVIRNVVDFAPAEVKQEADDLLDKLVRSYQKLDGYLEMANDGNSDAVLKAREQLHQTMNIAADIESLVRVQLQVG